MLNKFIVQGRLVKDPEILTASNQFEYARFTIAWNAAYKERKEELFLSSIAFGNTAKMLNTYFKKGDSLIAIGRLVTEKYADKEGNPRYSIKFRVEEVQFVLSKKEREQERQTNQYNKANNDYDSIEDSFVQSDVDEDDEDLPF